MSTDKLKFQRYKPEAWPYDAAISLAACSPTMLKLKSHIINKNSLIFSCAFIQCVLNANVVVLFPILLQDYLKNQRTEY